MVFAIIGSVTLVFILFCVVSVSLFPIISLHRLHEAQDADFLALDAYVWMVTSVLW